MWVPLEGEVAWLLPEGVKPYRHGHITGDRLRVRAVIEGQR